jgi:hypothetical protein
MRDALTPATKGLLARHVGFRYSNAGCSTANGHAADYRGEFYAAVRDARTRLVMAGVLSLNDAEEHYPVYVIRVGATGAQSAKPPKSSALRRAWCRED